MNLLINSNRFQLAVVDFDASKAIHLRSITDATVYHFVDIALLIDYLQTTADARECLILVISTNLAKNLPPNIKEIVFDMFIFDENNQNQFPTFNDVSLYLSGLIIAQCTGQSIYYQRLNENGPARIFAQESITRSKVLIEQLEDLCDKIDENISLGQDASS